MKVLSIDFDYFQDVTKEQLAMYPDGIDLPPELSDIVWSAKYLCFGDKLRKIDINTRLYQEIIRILLRQPKYASVMIANSHVKAYDFILGELRLRNNDSYTLTNVDLHHDIINENLTLDCGNWIRCLMDTERPRAFRWLCRELSLDVYGFSDKHKITLNRYIGLDRIKDSKGFDVIFICRSDPWLPPHLDGFFDDLLKICESHFDNIVVEPRVNCLRVLPEIKIER